LEIAMHDPELVPDNERGEHLPQEIRATFRRERRLFLDDLEQALAFQELHDEEAQAFVLAVVEHLHGRWMLEPRRRLRFALEARDRGCVLRQIRTQHLDRDALADLDLSRAVHGSHRARADELFDHVAPGDLPTDEGLVRALHRRSVPYGAETQSHPRYRSVAARIAHSSSRLTLPSCAARATEASRRRSASSK